MKTTYKLLSLLSLFLMFTVSVNATDDIQRPRPRTGGDAVVADDELLKTFDARIQTAQEIMNKEGASDQDRMAAAKEISDVTLLRQQRIAELDGAQAARQAQSESSSVAIASSENVGEDKFSRGGSKDPSVPYNRQCLSAVDPQAINCKAILASCSSSDCITEPVKAFKELVDKVEFEKPASCGQYFTGNSDFGATDFLKFAQSDQMKVKLCRLATAGCRPATGQDRPAIQRSYEICIDKAVAANLRAVSVGAQKCAAIYDAAASTTKFEAQAKAGGDPIVCKAHEGYAFDYPSCTNFLNWYMGLKASEMGLGIYNEADKTMTGMKAQNDMAKEIQKGNGQTAGLEASKRSTMAAADAESRNKLFFATKGTAISAQLMLFVTASSIEEKCEGGSGCCGMFSQSGPDKIKSDFFPNKGAKDHMIAEVIKAGGAAVAAALKEAELKKQAALMQAAKEQLAGPEDESEEGFMKFCQQYPHDVRCLGPGNRLSVGNNGYGSNFQGQNFGLGDLGSATTDEFNTETIAPGAGPGTAAAAVGGIGNMNKDAAQAKDIFNAPPAARGGGAPGAAGGAGAGGAGASASANGLSNDPGVQAEKTEDPLKVTSKKANYDGAAGYSGGSWQPGAAKKEAGAENPFAAMFNKNKGRDIAAAKEIDSPASDLFTKISNRYGEVQKRKGLMETPDTNIR